MFYGNQEKSLMPMTGTVRSSTITERLEEEAARLKTRLAELETAISALKKNPEIQEVFDLVSRLV